MFIKKIISVILPLLVYSKKFIITLNSDKPTIYEESNFFMEESDNIVETFSIGDFSGYIMEYSEFPIHLYSYSMISRIEEDQEVNLYRKKKIWKEDFEEYGYYRQTDPTWGLDRIDQRSNVLNKQYFYDTTSGKNVNAFIVDTGIDVSHPEFEGRAIHGINTVDTIDTDCNSHGTHVAGTIGSKTFGVAKQVTLYAVKVLDCRGSGSFSGILKGFEYVAEIHTKQGKQSVINMSLGGPKSESINMGVSELLKKGIHVVVAAGNENQDACNVSPASGSIISDIISVGATTDSSEMAGFSNYGKCVSVLAPGQDIESTVPGKKTTQMSGTSMASPHVAGVVALYLGEKGFVSTSEMKNRLVEMSTKNSIKNVKKDTQNALLFSLL